MGAGRGHGGFEGLVSPGLIPAGQPPDPGTARFTAQLTCMIKTRGQDVGSYDHGVNTPSMLKIGDAVTEAVRSTYSLPPKHVVIQYQPTPKQYE